MGKKSLKERLLATVPDNMRSARWFKADLVRLTKQFFSHTSVKRMEEDKWTKVEVSVRRTAWFAIGNIMVQLLKERDDRAYESVMALLLSQGTPICRDEAYSLVNDWQESVAKTEGDKNLKLLVQMARTIDHPVVLVELRPKGGIQLSETRDESVERLFIGWVERTVEKPDLNFTALKAMKIGEILAKGGTLSRERVSEILSKIPGNNPRIAPPTKVKKLITEEVSGIVFKNAVAALRWVNTANEGTIRKADIRACATSVLIKNRPFTSLAAVNATPGIGKKTLQAIRDASAKKVKKKTKKPAPAEIIAAAKSKPVQNPDSTPDNPPLGIMQQAIQDASKAATPIC